MIDIDRLMQVRELMHKLDVVVQLEEKAIKNYVKAIEASKVNLVSLNKQMALYRDLIWLIENPGRVLPPTFKEKDPTDNVIHVDFTKRRKVA